MPNLDAIHAFQWARQPKAEALVQSVLTDFLCRNLFASALEARMTAETGTRFYDWVDSIHLPINGRWEQQLRDAGFKPTTSKHLTIYRNEDGIFPAVVLDSSADAEPVVVYLKIDSVMDFLSVHQLSDQIAGEPFAPFRYAMVARENGAQLSVAERRGSAEFMTDATNPNARLAAARHLEHFRLRRRGFLQEMDGFVHANELVNAAIADLGVDQTCALFFQAEREFWQRRNRAAQVQKARQDRLGLGWGNHDHHTYRSSRACFKDLIALHEKLGLVCRERFYAGREAGWGAQVMENSRAGIVTFNDVDLSPEELVEDFAHRPLAPRDSLGTVGLWCALHGEAFLQAGMHHLECQFDFDALKQQLERDHGVGVMKPFTDYPYLRQAFTEGERWAVAPERIDKLLAAKLITPQQAEQFRAQGAIGSHLENLERNEGFKGFNQKGVSEIIAATDPRRHVAQVS